MTDRSSLRRRRRAARCGRWAFGAPGTSLLLLALCCGCSSGASRLELVSYKDPYFPERYTLVLDECAYDVDAGGDYHIVGRSSDQPDPDAGPVEQLLHVHLFWRPRPGKTHDNPTSVDAVIRYVIATHDGLAVYSGTGFIYPKRDRVSDTIRAAVENARLRLVEQRGQPPDLLGEARLTGTLAARDDANAAVNLMRTLDLLTAPAGER